METAVSSFPDREKLSQFLALKSSLELTPLRDLLEIYADNEEGDENNNKNNNVPRQHKKDNTRHKIFTDDHQELCWKILDSKIRNTLESRWKGYPRREANGDTTPTLEQVLSINFCQKRGVSCNHNERRRPPPKFALDTMVRLCQTEDHIICLVQKYPQALHLVDETTGNLLLHKVAEMGFKRKVLSVFEYVLLQGIKYNVKGRRGFGGLMAKNRSMRSPLVIMYGFVAGNQNHVLRWHWLSQIIKKVACIHALSLQNSNNDDYDDDASKDTDDENINTNINIDIDMEMVNRFPILHAAVEIGCPPGIINHILNQEKLFHRGAWIQSTRQLQIQDCFGRTPMQIACSRCTGDTVETIITFLQMDPKLALETDKNGNFLFHILLKSGITGQQRIHLEHVDDVSLIGTFVQNAPQLLFIRNVETGMYPFALAARDGGGWSLGVVYGLLRTAPYAIDSYVHD